MPINIERPEVSIAMGSDSDLDKMLPAAEVFEIFGVDYDVNIISAHRTAPDMMDYAKNLSNRGVRVCIAGAGGSAHLPGMIASETHIPVLGVPVKRPERGHEDEAEKSMNRMPPGVPLSVFPANGAHNAALGAIRILGLSNPELSQRYIDSQSAMAEGVKGKRELFLGLTIEELREYAK